VAVIGTALLLLLAAGAVESSFEACPEAKRAIGRTCGDMYPEAEFSGRVVYRRSDGKLKPVRKLRFWRGAGAEGGTVDPDGLWETRYRATATGYFSIPVVVAVSDIAYYCRGTIVGTSRYEEDVVFVLRAPKCRDLIVHYSPDWPAKQLEMDCE
jgi:hypothetical protein